MPLVGGGMDARVPVSPATMRGRPLFLARLAWMVVAATALAIMVFSLPSSFEQAVDRVTPDGAQALRDVGLSIRSYALLDPAAGKVCQLVWFVLGALIYLRRSEDPMALLVSVFLVAFGTVTFDTTAADSLVSSQPLWWLPVRGVQILGEVGIVLFFFLFPNGRFAPRWARWLAAAFIAFLVSRDLFPGMYSRPPALEGISEWVFLGFIASSVWSQIYRYRRVSSAEQRRQTRWVVFGTTLAVAGTSVFQLPLDLSLIGADTPLVLLVFHAGFTFSFLLLPLSIGVAMVRSRLFDVDVVINRTLVYGSLTAMLVTLYFTAIVVLQSLLVVLTGQTSTLAVVATTLLIAALFAPFRRRIQSFIDRRFYRKKYDARKTLEGLSTKLREETDLDALSEDLVSPVRDTVQPAHVSLWLRPRAEAEWSTKEWAG
jgi:hypothetical protein